jgi:hypothetical protein
VGHLGTELSAVDTLSLLLLFVSAGFPGRLAYSQLNTAALLHISLSRSVPKSSSRPQMVSLQTGILVK